MDPFAVLGLAPEATPEEIRRAFRDKARLTHPDAGVGSGDMGTLVDAYRAAMAASKRPRRPLRSARHRAERDVASFTVDALPAEAFEGLSLVAASVGDVADEEPPYAIEFILRAGEGVWCRCDIVPDAGACTVSVTVVQMGQPTGLDCEAIRDLLVAELNELDWSSVTGR